MNPMMLTPFKPSSINNLFLNIYSIIHIFRSILSRLQNISCLQSQWSLGPAIALHFLTLFVFSKLLILTEI